MKVVLLRDIPSVGRKNDIKNVSDGYALNFLFPRSLAESATAAAIKRAEGAKKSQEETEMKKDAIVKEAAQALKNKKVVVAGKANEKGHLFAGIDAPQILKALDEMNIKLPEGALVMKEHIKSIGEHTVELKHKNEIYKFVVEVKSA